MKLTEVKSTMSLYLNNMQLIFNLMMLSLGWWFTYYTYDCFLNYFKQIEPLPRNLAQLWIWIKMPEFVSQLEKISLEIIFATVFLVFLFSCLQGTWQFLRECTE